MRLATLLGPDLKQVLKEDPEEVRALLEEIHPEDLADIVAELDADEAAQLMARMPADAAAPIFERLEEHEQEEIAERMPPESVAHIASEMEPDDRADLFSLLPEAMGDEIREKLEKVDPEAAEEIREIEKWPDTSAGHLMTTRYVQIAPESMVSDAIAAVRAFAQESDAPVYAVYVMRPGGFSSRPPAGTEGPRARPLFGTRGVLEGIVSLRELVIAQPYQRIEELMRTNIISVPPDLDQEEVARRMAKYDLNAMPVIGEQGVLLGVITVDDVIDVLTQEQTEDVQKIGGVEPLEVPYFQTSFSAFMRKRGFWLLVLFLGEFFTTSALRYYDPIFKAVEAAGYYVPLLISAGGNSGSQSSTLVIRGLAVGDMKGSDWLRILRREMGMGLSLGLMLAVVGFGRVLMYPEQTVAFAFTIALSLVGIVVAGCTVGSMLPILLRRMGFDPAASSTPFIASLVDVLGIIIFVQMAKIMLASVIAGHP